MNSHNLELVASGRVNGADGATTTATGMFAKGCSVARAGAGLYDVTLDAGPTVGEADTTECVCFITVETGDRHVHMTHTSDSVKRFLVRDNAAAAADSTFQFAIFRVRSNVGG